MDSGSSSGGLPPDTSRGTQMLIAIWTMDAIGAVVVAIRIFTSAAILRKVSLPDYLIVIALLLGISNSALLTVSEHWGLGRHIMYLTPVQTEVCMKWQTFSIPLGIMCPAIGRLSFTLYLLRIFGIYEVKRYILHACVWINLIVAVLWVILVFARCGKHVTAVWHPHAWSPNHCLPQRVESYFSYFQGAINTSLDLVLTCLPAWAVWNIQMPQRVKKALMVLLGFSLFAAIASIAKTVSMHIFMEDDITYKYVRFAIWLTVENNVVIVATSIPAIKPLFPRKKACSGNNLSPYNGHTLVENSSRRTNSKNIGFSSHNQSEVTSGGQECEMDRVIIKSTTVMQNFVGYDDGDDGRPSQAESQAESQVELARTV